MDKWVKIGVIVQVVSLALQILSILKPSQNESTVIPSIWGVASLLSPIISGCILLTCVWIVYVYGHRSGGHYSGHEKLIIHYAGWGRGPEEDAYVDVTKTLIGLKRGEEVNVKADDIHFGHHYSGEPRTLRVEYSYGKIARRTVVFPEHHFVRLPEPRY